MSAGKKHNDLNDALNAAQEKLRHAQAHKMREAAFAVEANERFDKNLTAFRHYYPDIADFIQSYQTRDDFCLHVTESGDATFYPEGSDVPIYGDNPRAQAKEQVEHYVQHANFGRTDYFKASSETASSEDERLHLRYMYKLVRELAKTKSIESKPLTELPESFPSCLIFGIGLGYHIPELLDKCKFDYVFICEPDLEMFFASLFCIDWSDVIHRLDEQDACLFLHLGTSYESFFNEVFQVAEDIGAYSVINSFCYQHYPSEKVNKLIKTFFSNYYQLHQGFGFYNDAITGLAHGIRNIEQGGEFLFANKKAYELVGNTPAFVVGNGPSLDAAIEVLKNFNGQAVIFAAGTAYQSLLKAGVTADFHVLVERPRITYDIQRTIEPEQGYGDTNLLAVDVMYPDVLGLYKWAGLGLKGPEAASSFISTHTKKKYGVSATTLPASGPMVSNTALSFALCMGFTEVYLFGVDNGYSLGGVTHSELSIYNDKKLKEQFKPLKGARIEFEGNLEHPVKATPLMAMSKTTFDRLVKGASQCHVYNVGEGAKIEGAMALKESDVGLANTVTDKCKLVEDLKSLLFKSVEIEDIETKISFEEFDSLCQYLIDIGNRDFSSRDEAHAILKSQQRLVYAYRKSVNPHLFNLLKGSLLYFHCPLITLLYYFDDEQETLKHFRSAFSVWLELIEKIKDDFPVNWKAKCTWTKPQYQQYKEAK
ncbi:motility associated factor glycosyltransferase family protein [Pseudoalteromonas ruthenica]|uniref:motility associated factor glycosyltransferase family protein n=1 Tax=Pseudoalteromonas ruthenica TaxID=151081 RepID=UPI00110B7BF7|nr:6-hydroxymethylpterin diphosphokinase MptE-like protein [Pseudoalteromonas ruthenica]TMO43806.1 septum formation inhibitor Maf [Pseudoalteromonas ruthenica]TMO51725.1 septum formation inhibitor Maf [Pseudoalteromonas ruthenica]